jgi:hypothetical protein
MGFAAPAKLPMANAAPVLRKSRRFIIVLLSLGPKCLIAPCRALRAENRIAGIVKMALGAFHGPYFL